MHTNTLLLALFATASTAAAAAVSPNTNMLMARASGECGTGNCRNVDDNGKKTYKNKATRACCEMQIKGLLGLGLFGNDNLRIIDDGVGKEEVLSCLTKTDEGEQIDKPEFQQCCKSHKAGSFCV